MQKLDIKGLGVAFGTLTALYMLLAGLTAALAGWGNGFVDVLSAIYIGYEATIPGAIIGGIYGFIDGFVGGAIVAWIYNKVSG